MKREIKKNYNAQRILTFKNNAEITQRILTFPE